MAIKPILFNTEMVRAILDGRKTVTRRLVKFLSRKNPNWTGYVKDGLMLYNGRNEPCIKKAPYQLGDILYVRESYSELSFGYVYKADGENIDHLGNVIKWHPSIHMPKEAARIWLKVRMLGWSGCRRCGRAMRQKKGYSLINQQQPMKCCKHLPNYGTAQSRNPTLTATDGMRIRGFGLSNLSGARSRNKRFNKIVD